MEHLPLELVDTIFEYLPFLDVVSTARSVVLSPRLPSSNTNVAAPRSVCRTTTIGVAPKLSTLFEAIGPHVRTLIIDEPRVRPWRR